MARLYTCKGDLGYTDSADGKRVPKDDVMIEIIGTLDEFSSMLGVAKTHTENEALILDIENLQNITVSVMTELSGFGMRITKETVKNVEDMIDKYGVGFSGFTLPGATKASAFLDTSRCIIRRAERIACKAYRKKQISEPVMCWLNRVSDLVYAMGRYAAKQIGKDFIYEHQ